MELMVEELHAGAHTRFQRGKETERKEKKPQNSVHDS